MNKIENSSMYGTCGNLEYLNEMIEYYEYYYNLCLEEGELIEAEAFKQALDDLYEKRYNIYIEQLRNKERDKLNSDLKRLGII